MNWTEMTCTKLTQLHDALLVTRVSVTKLIGCRAAVHALRFSSVQFSSSAVFPQLNWTDLKSRSHLRWRCYAARCCARDSNSVYFNGDIYAYAVAKRLLCFTSAAQRRAGHRERQCADTTGTVLVPSTGHFQCWSTNIFFIWNTWKHFHQTALGTSYCLKSAKRVLQFLKNSLCYLLLFSTHFRSLCVNGSWRRLCWIEPRHGAIGDRT